MEKAPPSLEVSSQWQVVGLSIGILAVIVAVQFYLTPKTLDAIPLVGAESSANRKKQPVSCSLWEFYQEGYRMVRSGLHPMGLFDSRRDRSGPVHIISAFLQPLASLFNIL
jgi:hypothetical protein